MSKEDKVPPRRTFRLGDERYVQVVFQIKSSNLRGIPLECVLLEDEQVVNLTGGEKFMTALIKEKMLEGDL